MLITDVARRIRSQREKRGLKQQDLANALSISPQAVSKWERAENLPDIALLAPLARLLGVTVDWLLAAQEEDRDVFPATVIATTVRGAWKRSLEMHPRDFAAWANGLFQPLTELTLQADGIPIKYMGDRYLCFFSGTDHARRGLEMGWRARQVIADDLRIGVCAGDIYLGSVGHPDYARPDIMGQTVNCAFLVSDWAEQHAESGVAATSAVLAPLGDAITTGKREEASFLGIEDPVAIAEVTAVGAG
jgi:transcriptional regulator with XRE-family HTH domain